MQFTKPFKIGIRDGEIRVSFRRWKAPQAKPGGRYNIHPYGAIEVDRVREVRPVDITEADALAAGFESAAALLDYLRVSTDDEQALTRVDFHFLGAAAVNQPDRSVDATAVADAVERLTAMDTRAERSGKGPWAWRMLALIAQYPGRRAAEHAAELGWETATLKTHVRRLKQLGLTESLEVGYRVTPRGERCLKHAET